MLIASTVIASTRDEFGLPCASSGRLPAQAVHKSANVCADMRQLFELAEAGRRPNLVTQGSTELVHALLANNLVDAMTHLHAAGRAWRRQKAVPPTARRRIRSS